MKYECTGVILAGGTNRRFPGKKKTFRRVGNEMMLTRIYSLFSKMFNEVILVVNDPKAFVGWDMMVVTDIHPSRCALAGLHAGLFYASNPWAYVTACDVPFVNERVIGHLIDQREPGKEVIIPRTADGLEPLAAVYSRECIPAIENSLANNNLMIKKFFRQKKIKEIPVSDLKKLDPTMRFMFNINTPEDFEKAIILEAQDTIKGEGSP
ncbi:MAG: molybdenum cofactor guanylyltransferase [Proteobacteria bacterium]|nr:molybdenum cofactor guanylyltransferase [Desulfobacula sp.]MBU3951691.1 molybdenum cofactor guanylyltransferase [Pseudomonadota bacterium]MBU4132379.1 molybdenum cofactor guanylyltransferase [Pseudomonadota bacterium]